MAETEAGRMAPDYLDVLLVCSSPVNVSPSLDLHHEVTDLENEVRRAPIPIRLRRVYPPTIRQLERELSPNALRLRQPKILHLLGHGAEDGLWFEREDGSGELVKVAQIRQTLQDSPIELAIINACWSGSGRVVSLCERLVRDGVVKTALGHERPVADVSAIAYAQRLYEQLLDGYSVREAHQRAANYLTEEGLPGATEVQLVGDADLRPAEGLAPGERTGRVEGGPPVGLPDLGYFCGRADEYLRIANTLDDRHQTAFGIWGIGGIGKTHLTAEIARRNGWRYPGGVAWVDAREVTEGTAAGVLRAALSRLRQGATADDPGAGLLAVFGGEPAMVVLDNLETLPPEAAEPLVRFVEQMPRNGSRALLTARVGLAGFERRKCVQSLPLTRGLDDYNGAQYAYRVTVAKGIAALRNEPPRESKEHRVEGRCAQISRRVSGHPRMIEVAVGMARHGMDALDEALTGLTGELADQLQDLLATGLALVGEEGQRLLAYLPLFPTARFTPEEMGAACQAAEQFRPAHPIRAATVTDRAPAETGPLSDVRGSDELPAVAAVPWLPSALQQLERAAFLDHDQTTQVYTFHQTLLEHAQHHAELPEEEHTVAAFGLLAFYARYLDANTDNYPAIDRCFGNAMALMESV
ncbi:MAG: hypothetical protein COY42_23915 [Armatimonadetes bacterium CG_4_10_14_0_8_um_filter_66_14]|nr:MAG: hypothetical protein COY42_23915 [Armatimonadetes bacterium CG_4_10_14_0_8_um_filter_66_14]